MEEDRVNLFFPAVPAAAWDGRAAPRHRSSLPEPSSVSRPHSGVPFLIAQDSRTCTWTQSMQIKVGIVAVINPSRIFRGSARARFFFFPGLFLLKLEQVFVDAGAR